MLILQIKKAKKSFVPILLMLEYPKQRNIIFSDFFLFMETYRLPDSKLQREGYIQLLVVLVNSSRKNQFHLYGELLL